MARTGQVQMVLLGDVDVGKSSLALRFAKGKYVENASSTIGAAFLNATVQIDPETSIKIDLWDTAGQERYHSIAPLYYRSAQAALIVYDITRRDSFHRAKHWVKELREVRGTNIVIGLVGNKVDLTSSDGERVNRDEAAEYAEDNGLIFMEVSAKQNDKVAEIFKAVTKRIVEKQSTGTSNTANTSIRPTTTKTRKNGSCCTSKSKS